VLYWISNATRPLLITELQNALTIEPGETSLDEDRIVIPKYLVLVCSGLVMVKKESQVIRLVHYSTEEYLQIRQQSLFPDAYEKIATASLTYLSCTVNAAFNCSEMEEIDSLCRKNPFYMYAAQCWGDHARRGGLKIASKILF
jgi:hypothetical protein